MSGSAEKIPSGAGSEAKKEAPEKEAVPKSSEKNVNETINFLSPESHGFFNKMSEGGKAIVSKIYEGLHKIPQVSRIIGKLEIIPRQIVMDHYETKAAQKKDKMDGVDIEISYLEKSKTELENAVKKLKEQKIPDASLQIELRNIEKRKMKLLNSRDKIQTKFENFDNKMKVYANKRDQIADNLIGRFDEKLKPMEKDLGNLQTCKERLDLLSSAMELKHQKKMEEINNLEKQKGEIEELFKSIGKSDRAVKRNEAVKGLESIIAKRRGEMRKDKENLENRKTKLDKEIAKKNKKAGPYRDKREEFVRVKAIRPVKMEAPERGKEKVFEGKEEIKAYPRKEYSDSGEDENQAEEGGSEEKMETGTETETEDSPEQENKEEEKYGKWQTVSNYIDSWNLGIKNSEKKYPLLKEKMIDLKDFLRTSELPKDFQLNLEELLKLIKKYCKFRKIEFSDKDEKMMNKVLKDFEDNAKQISKSDENKEKAQAQT